jgi:hypothetical protein
LQAIADPDIDRKPYRAELDAAYEAARQAGLWRFDERGSGLRPFPG